MVIVCTSNRAPWELSPAGAHEDMFAHFVGQLTRACPPFELSSERDYRRLDTSWQVGASLRVLAAQAQHDEECRKDMVA